MKAFISYSTKDKHAAASVKKALANSDIDCFMAHDDLHVSEKWKDRILEELLNCDIFIPLLSRNFKESEWAPQEIGIITARPDVPVVPLSLDGTIPFGFISHIQSQRLATNGLDIATVLNPISKTHPRLVLPIMINRVRHANDFRSAESVMLPLVQHFEVLSEDELNDLVDASIENGQVWDATLCRKEYFPELIKINRVRIPPDKLRVLEYQIEHGRWYEDSYNFENDSKTSGIPE